MRVFLTGATGFLGGEIARQLLARGHDCAALARGEIGETRLAALAGRVSVVRGDLFSPGSYRDALRQFQPDALIHCAWRGVAGAERNDLAQLENIVASARLAEAAIESGARAIIGAGSQAEYGAKPGPVSESDPASPETLYGVAKLAAAGTFLNLARAQGRRAAWGRVFSLYGPGDEGPWLVPALIRAFRARQAPELTACEQIWEFTHVRDAARAFVDLAEAPEAHGVFNVGAAAPIVLRDAVLTLRDLVAPGVEPRFGAVPYRHDQVMHLEARIDRLRAATGWRPEIPLESGFAETVRSFLERRAA